jgi:hypothetical protein
MGIENGGVPERLRCLHTAKTVAVDLCIGVAGTAPQAVCNRECWNGTIVVSQRIDQAVNDGWRQVWSRGIMDEDKVGRRLGKRFQSPVYRFLS